jgi:type IV secretory pathway TrbD component
VHPDPRPYDDEPATLDVAALRRRVLLTGLLTLLLFLVAGYVLTALEASGLWLLPVMLLVWVAVVRPLMAPVRAATKLRRALAFQAFLDARADGELGAEERR